MLKLKLQYFGHLGWRADSLERTLKLGKIEGKKRRSWRGWDGWIPSLTQWTWVWASSGWQWRTGKPGVLQSMGSQTVGHKLATEQQISLIDKMQQFIINLFLFLLSQALRTGSKRGQSIASGSLLLTVSPSWKSSLLTMVSFMSFFNSKSVILSLRWEPKWIYKKHLICLPCGLSKIVAIITHSAWFSKKEGEIQCRCF